MRPIDPQIEKDITALMTCAPLNCAREHSCFRVAKFARDQVRKMHATSPAVESGQAMVSVDHYAPHYPWVEADTGAWEAA